MQCRRLIGTENQANRISLKNFELIELQKHVSMTPLNFFQFLVSNLHNLHCGTPTMVSPTLQMHFKFCTQVFCFIMSSLLALYYCLFIYFLLPLDALPHFNHLKLSSCLPIVYHFTKFPHFLPPT